MYLNEVQSQPKGKLAVIMKVMAWLGKPKMPEIMNLIAFKPKRNQHLLNFVQDLMRGPGSLDFGTRELIFSFCSKKNGCNFCGDSHVACAKEFMAPALVDAVIADFWTAPIPDRLKFLLSYCDRVRQRLPVGEDAVSILQDHGWSQEQIYDAIQIVCLSAFFNRWVDANGVATMTPAEYEATAKQLAKSYN